MKKRPKNVYANDLRQPKYKMQVQKDKKRKEEIKSLITWMKKYLDSLVDLIEGE